MRKVKENFLAFYTKLSITKERCTLSCKKHFLTMGVAYPESSASWVFIQFMHDEGIINDQFSHIQNLKMVGRADHFVQLINMYCLDVENILSQLASYSDLPNVDFSKLAALAAEVGERSSRIGAEHVRLACLDLMQACDQMQKQNFLRALTWTKNEFDHTRNKLQVLVQMERRIMRLEAKQQN